MRLLFFLLEMLAALPLLILVFWLLRKCGLLCKACTACYFVFAAYLCAVFTLVGFPSILSVTLDLSANWIPFWGLLSDFRNACLNVLLFIPFGFLLPVLWEGYRGLKETAVRGLLLSCLIEGLQLFTFRTTDVNDLLTNTLGSVLGFLLARAVTRGFTKWVCNQSRRRDAVILMLASMGVMFLGQPFVSGIIWEIYGAISTLVRAQCYVG